MIVVADTTPLISLMKIDKLALLQSLFGKVYIPEAVYHELVRNPLFEREALIVKNCEYICVIKISDERAVRILRRATGLVLGEREAIVLTDEQQADLLLMDEAKGRAVAREQSAEELLRTAKKFQFGNGGFGENGNDNR